MHDLKPVRVRESGDMFTVYGLQSRKALELIPPGDLEVEYLPLRTDDD